MKALFLLLILAPSLASAQQIGGSVGLIVSQHRAVPRSRSYTILLRSPVELEYTNLKGSGVSNEVPCGGLVPDPSVCASRPTNVQFSGWIVGAGYGFGVLKTDRVSMTLSPMVHGGRASSTRKTVAGNRRSAAPEPLRGVSLTLSAEPRLGGISRLFHPRAGLRLYYLKAPDAHCVDCTDLYRGGFDALSVFLSLTFG